MLKGKNALLYAGNVLDPDVWDVAHCNIKIKIKSVLTLTLNRKCQVRLVTNCRNVEQVQSMVIGDILFLLYTCTCKMNTISLLW